MVSPQKHIDIQGVRVPTFVYGTAWKEDNTERLTRLALESGFTGIDTANQRRHYFEEGVGAALREFDRDQLFLQTKFTYVYGQDHRLPYDPEATLRTQVEQSVTSSLEHLGTDHIDAYLLHGPASGLGMTAVDWETWHAMEEVARSGRTLLLGISNVTLNHLRELVAKASIKPALVQNRCYAAQGWDRDVRAFCAEHGILYQGFSLLTANGPVWEDPRVRTIAAKLGKTPAQALFRFALQSGMVLLTGTSSATHMAEDLAVFDFELEPSDVSLIETMLG